MTVMGMVILVTLVRVVMAKVRVMMILMLVMERHDMDCGVDNSGNGDEMIVMLLMEIVTVVLMVTMAMGCR